MIDLFDREQRIYDDAIHYIKEMQSGASCDAKEFEALTKEYGRLLKQLRRITKLSDRTTVNLNASKLDLLDKVHYDALTGIYNRRFLEESLKRIIKSISRSGGMLSVLMIDVDFFKKYNDTYGHSRGDDCLKAIAETLKNSITRADDFAARYGGEEFIAVLPGTDESGAQMIADRLLENIRSLGIPHEKNDAAHCVTVSIGITTSNVHHTQKSDDYIKRADEALYMSKQSGRNKCTFLNFEEKTT